MNQRMKMLLALFLIITGLNGFTISNCGPTDHLVSYEAAYIKQALELDPFFRDLVQEGDHLGYGSFGIVLKMYKMVDSAKKYYAVKFGSIQKINEAGFLPDQSTLTTYSGDLNSTVLGNRFVEYLRSQKVAFLPNTIVFKYVLFPHIAYPSAPVLKIIQAMEIADLGNLYNYGSQMAADTEKSVFDQATRDKFFLDMALKSALSISKFNGLSVLQGDIKGVNIFLRSNAREDYPFLTDIDPVIGDWDFGYKYGPDNLSNERRYTPTYCPIEMKVFETTQNDRYSNLFLVNSNNGYHYSGKEDVFALGVTLIKLFIDIQPHLSEELQTLLNDMIHPLPGHRFGDYTTDTDSLHNAVINDFKRNLMKHIDKEFKKKLGIMENIASEAYTKSIELKDKYPAFFNAFSDYVDFYQEQTTPLAFMVFTQSFRQTFEKLEHNKNFHAFQGEVLTPEQWETFISCEEYLKNNNPYETLLAQRPSPNEVLKTLIAEINKTSYPTSTLDAESLYELIESEVAVRSSEDSAKNSGIYVFNAIYTSVSAFNIKAICQFYNALTTENPHEDQVFQIPGEDPVIHINAFNFCKKMMHLINTNATVEELKELTIDDINYRKKRNLKDNELATKKSVKHGLI